MTYPLITKNALFASCITQASIDRDVARRAFAQMKNPNSTRPTQCPFCKTSNYAVEYRGVKTKEEKGVEQVEEQRVIEAKIRMRQQEIQDEEERMQKRIDRSSSSASVAPVESERSCPAVEPFGSPIENEDVVSSQRSIRHPPPPYYRVNRDDEFDLDLEDIMVMEAIWLSIQENGRQKSPLYVDVASSENYAVQSHYALQPTAPVSGSSSSPSGGLACAIAALAERQQLGGESSVSTNENMPACNMLPGSCSFYNRMGPDTENYPPAHSSITVSRNCRMANARDDCEWAADRGSDTAEAGTSYASSDIAEDGGGICTLLPPPPPPPPDESGDRFESNSGTIVPESFEEQMMLAMAVSLAEAQAATSEPGSAWQ